MNARHPIALSASHVSVLHGDFKAVNDVSLSLKSGEWMALVGPNGAGKSSLLKALAGLTPATGEVALLGKPWVEWPRRQRAQTLAWLGQAEAGQDDLTVYDVAMLGRLPHQAWLAPPSAQDHAAIWALRQDRSGAITRDDIRNALEFDDRPEPVVEVVPEPVVVEVPVVVAEPVEEEVATPPAAEPEADQE